MHLKHSSLFCVFTDLDVMYSPNSRFMTEIMVSSLFRWLYSNLEYPYFICFLYLPCVFHIGTFSYLTGITLYACSCSLIRTWLSSPSYALSAVTTDNGRIVDIFVIKVGGKVYRVVSYRSTRLIFTAQIICFSTSAPNDSLMYFLLFTLVLSV